VYAAPARAYRRAPGPAAWLGAGLAPLERFFDVLFGSRLNPLYRSGTLAFFFLTMATGTGIFLLLYYRLGDPYGSVQRLQSQLWFGRWMRAWHRYLADAAAVATLFHLLRMAAEGKTWGPRALAWISGVVLAGAMVFTAYTGFVMAWDRQGQWLAVAGARMADLLPIFPEPIGRAFSGGTAPPASFFFMNLFLHVALPLGLIFLLWLHTSRLARSAWLPDRKAAWGWALALLVLAMVWPAPLGQAADPLALAGSYPMDLFYLPWLALSLGLPAGWTLAAGLAAAAAAMSVPWWWRPAAQAQPAPSYNDEARCQGCVQCTLDCPFEAISMVPRTVGSGSAEVARVDPALCVSCGLCVASCDRLSIGPPDRIGTRQMAEMQALARRHQADSVVLLHCRNSPVAAAFVREAMDSGAAVLPHPLDCVGDLHPFAVHSLQNHFKGVFVLSCPPAACQMREGADLARRRLLEGREPAGKVALDAARLRLVHASLGERAELRHDWQAFQAQLGLGPPAEPARLPSRLFRAGRLALAGVPLLLLLALLSAFQAGQASPEAALRLSWRLPGQAVKTCRDLSEAELAARPAHMRRKQECVSRRLSYRLRLELDGATALDETVAPRGARGDSPLNVNRQLGVAPGRHALRLAFEPLDDPTGQGQSLAYAGSWTAVADRAGLLTLDLDGKKLEWLEKAR
jgi:ferredoxin/coenzyme F420-reducing hydrogenase delta subunit